VTTSSATQYQQCFSDSYGQARSRFLGLLEKHGAQHLSYLIDASSDEPLAIDVGIVGPVGAPCLLTSSGVHGIEGYFGSAVQLAMLGSSLREDIRYIFVHAVNPYGMSHMRRFNEDGIDLNRNFLEPGNFSGAAPAYQSLNGLLNPRSPPSRLEPFRIKALATIARYGLPAHREAIACGQYEYPQGIFFGGSAPCQSADIVMQHVKQWCAGSDTIVHLDWHTGLGDFGSYNLMLDEYADSDTYHWFCQSFGADCVEAKNAEDSTAYPVHGLYGRWVRGHLSDKCYLFCTAEFGTYDPIRVLASIRAENRAHHYGTSTHKKAAKAELLECFSPANSSWRKAVVASAIDIVNSAVNGIT